MNDLDHFTQIGKEESDFEYVNGGVPQGSKLGPIAFVVKINMLPCVLGAVYMSPVCRAGPLKRGARLHHNFI